MQLASVPKLLTCSARDRVFGHTSCWPTTSVEELGLERAEEALGHGVVPAITLAAHRAHDAVLIEHGLVGRSRVLSTTV